jgi:hypothetical protein
VARRGAAAAYLPAMGSPSIRSLNRAQTAPFSAQTVDHGAAAYRRAGKGQPKGSQTVATGGVKVMSDRALAALVSQILQAGLRASQKQLANRLGSRKVATDESASQFGLSGFRQMRR